MVASPPPHFPNLLQETLQLIKLDLVAIAPWLCCDRAVAACHAHCRSPFSRLNVGEEEERENLAIIIFTLFTAEVVSLFTNRSPALPMASV
jgi:hypothetical protein